MKVFNTYLTPWKLDAQKGETKEKYPWKTTDDELELLKEKVSCFLQVSLKIFAYASSFVVMKLKQCGMIVQYMGFFFQKNMVRL